MTAGDLDDPDSSQQRARVRRRGVLTVALATALLAGILVATSSNLPHGAAQMRTAGGSAPAGTPDEADRRPVKKHNRPNIVLITSDDQTDTELRWMPRTRRLLGKAGIDFVDGVSPHPICCPARAEILTGEYAHNNGVRHNTGRYGGYAAFMRNNADENLAVWLRRAGYHTGFVGKTMNGFDAGSRRMPGWDFWSPSLRATYAYYGTQFGNNGRPRTWPGKYVADVVRDESDRLVRTWARSRKPFFLWASHVGPHDASVGGRWQPPVPAERHARMFGNVRMPTARKPSFVEKDVSDKPRRVQAAKPKSRLRWRFQQRIRSLQAIDEANASMIRTLEQTGQLRNTLVVYVSDNGYQLGEHGLFDKNYPYEESLQVPFLMRGPGVARGARSREPAGRSGGGR